MLDPAGGTETPQYQELDVMKIRAWAEAILNTPVRGYQELNVVHLGVCKGVSLRCMCRLAIQTEMWTKIYEGVPAYVKPMLEVRVAC